MGHRPAAQGLRECQIPHLELDPRLGQGRVHLVQGGVLLGEEEGLQVLRQQLPALLPECVVAGRRHEKGDQLCMAQPGKGGNVCSKAPLATGICNTAIHSHTG